MNDATTQLITILTGHFGMDPAEIEPASTFDELAVDSLIIVELALVLRRETGVHLEDWDLTPDMTIAEAGAFIAAREAAVTA